jgi:hypothetical protein
LNAPHYSPAKASKNTINFHNVEPLETAEQHGRIGTKGRYILVEQTAKMLSELVNVTPS